VIRGITALAIALLVAACGGAPLPPPVTAGPSAAPAVTPLPAGTYTSVNFQPAVTFTVPDGWVLETDGPLYLSLRPVDNEMIGIHLFRDPKAASQDPTCPASPEPGVGGTSSELATWIGKRPGLAVSSPAMATVGGVPGTTIDVGLAADWTQSCPFANGTPAVPLFNSPAIDHWVVVGNERLRLYLLDVAAGATVVVDLDAYDGDQIEDLIARSAGILRSLKFGPVAPASAAPASTTP
jgi:hypothetical protein